jgi:hypothetical protein
MALANAGWDDYSFGRSGSASKRPRRGSFGTLVASAVVVTGLFAGLSEWRTMESAAPAISATVRPGPAGGRTARLAAPPTSALERNAESFLRDSLLLTQQCQAMCTQPVPDIEEAALSGRFGPPGVATSPGNAPLTTGLPVVAQFGAPLALVSPAVSPEIPATVIPPVAPAPVRIAPSVVVPLPPVFFAPAAPTAPVPAARLERSAGEIAAVATPSAPRDETTAPVTGRGQATLSTLGVGRNSGVAVYDISAAMVYLPDGQRLEAHSGMGPMVDNPRFVDRIDTGPTPPNVYNLIMRKGRFHGVEALRLIPADGNNRFGRVGLLAHTYLLRGRPAESNGCVAFKDYSRFLDAFKRGQIARLIVVPNLSGSSMRIASAGNT